MQQKTETPVAEMPPVAGGSFVPSVTALTPPKGGKQGTGRRGRRPGSGHAKPIEAQQPPVAAPDMTAAAIASLEQQIAAIKRAAGIAA